jgi:prolipoprotein diacylglyceryl transferase
VILPISKDVSGGYRFGYAGLASHGGVAGIIIAIIIYCYKKNQKVWDVLDKLGLVGPLAGFFIRSGNFFNSEIIGTPSDMPWAIIFKRVDMLPRHPSQLYEALCYLLIFCIVYYIYTKKRDQHQHGFVFGITIFLVFVSRFLLEYTKVVQSSFEESLPLDMGQILSIPFVLLGVIVIITRCSRKLF